MQPLIYLFFHLRIVSSHHNPDPLDYVLLVMKLTELNLMTYDFHGSWNDKSGVNAPLYDQDDSPDFSVHGA